MKYEEESRKSLTESEIYRITVAAIRAGVDSSRTIYICMSFEKFDEINCGSMRPTSTEHFGTVEYNSPIGTVYFLVLAHETNTITVQN